jgi:DNA mismatch repair protein MutS
MTARCSNVLDRTATAMGGRMLRQWLMRPLVALARIQDRLDAVEDLRIPRHRARQAARAAEEHARHRAPGGAHLARHRGPARCGALGAVARAAATLHTLAAGLQAPLLAA